MVDNNKKEISEKSAVLLEKEKFYQEEDISPEVRSVLDAVFAEMTADDMGGFLNNTEVSLENSAENHVDEPNVSLTQEVLLEKEKLYAEEELSPEVKAVLDDVFSEMISVENLEIYKEETQTIDKETKVKKEPVLLLEEPETIEKDEKIKELSQTVDMYTNKIKDLEEKMEYYKDLVVDFEEKSKTMENSKKQFEQRLKELDESRAEFEERGGKLEKARESFKQLSKNLEEKKVVLEQREKNINQMQRELDKLQQKHIEKENKISSKKSSINRSHEDIEFVTEPITTSISQSSEEMNGFELIQMERGKVDILQDILQELLFQGDFQSCFLIDGQGMIISEYSKTELDALAIGAMFSLVCTTVLRTIKSLSLSELEYFKLSSINGEFILRNIEINNYERNFILLAYYNESNSNLPMKKQKLSKKTIKEIMRSVKKDFDESRNDSKISWVFDNLSDKISFLKQKYNHFEGDINLIRLNLMNKASLKVRELFEM